MGWTQWKEDLIQDIRFSDNRDNMDYNNGEFPEIPPTNWNAATYNKDSKGAVVTISNCNMAALEEQFSRIKNECKCILEIGVDCNGDPTEQTSSRVFMREKLKDTVYIGIDINDKSYLDNESENIYTIKTDSSDIEKVVNFMNSKGAHEIDFLFIDGWHSINQVMREWEYTRYLSPNGIVGFHDTQYHPGPHMFVKYLDRKKWNVIENACTHNLDFGIGFAWRKK